MVGGVGALANGAGLLGNIAQQASTTGMNASSVAGGGNNLSAFTNPAADAAPSMGSAAATGDTVSQVADAGKSLNGDPYAPDPSAANGGVISGNSSQVAAATKSPVQPLVGGGASNVSPTDTTNMPSGIPGSSISVGIGGSISKVGQFIKDNKELVNVAGGLVGGAMNDVAKQKQQQRQYELEEQAKLAARKRYNDSMVGTKAPVYVPPPLASAKG